MKLEDSVSLPLIALSTLALLAGCQPGPQVSPAEGSEAAKIRDPYTRAIALTANMNQSPEAERLARRHGLEILDLTWEDTARFKGSSVGPNISDLTIQVAHAERKTGKLNVTAMPVIRFPNFSDKTTDLAPQDFTLLVGNHAGRQLKRVSLFEFLKEPTRFLSKPRSWTGRMPKTLLAERDRKVLVSAQACFLPVPSKGKATFNPVIFNYRNGEVVGSLVTGGRTGRVTEYDGAKIQPPGWWDGFWKRHYKNTGDRPATARAKLLRLLGEDYQKRPVCELYLRDLLR